MMQLRKPFGPAHYIVLSRRPGFETRRGFLFTFHILANFDRGQLALRIDLGTCFGSLPGKLHAFS